MYTGLASQDVNYPLINIMAYKLSTFTNGYFIKKKKKKCPVLKKTIITLYLTFPTTFLHFLSVSFHQIYDRLSFYLFEQN